MYTKIGQRISTRVSAGPEGGDERCGVRAAQAQFLDELPGIVIAVITLAWIVYSLASLNGQNASAQMAAIGAAISRGVLHAARLAIEPPHPIRIAWRLGSTVALAKRVFDFASQRNIRRT